MPTTRPRYAVTDTGEVREWLDAAQRRWPEVTDRKQLLLRLAEEGRSAIAAELETASRARRVDRQAAALQRAGELIEVEALMADAAWR